MPQVQGYHGIGKVFWVSCMALPRYANRALRDTAFLRGLRSAIASSNEQDAIASFLDSHVWLRYASQQQSLA